MSRRRGGNRLKYQVEQAITQINYIGQGKRVAREEKRSGIHSTTQIKHVLSVSQNFGKWLKQQGITDLYGVKKSHYVDYVEFLRQKGCSNGHLINVETNLKLLAKGMDKVSIEKGMRTREWIPKKRIVSASIREQPVSRSLTQERVQEVRAAVSENVGVAMDLQLAFGLRLREVAQSRVSHVVEHQGKMYWEAVSDRLAVNTAVGVTKAGRARRTPVRPEYEHFVRELIKGRTEEEKLCAVSYNSLKTSYSRVGLGGSHALRHTYAENMLLNELKNYGILEDGKQLVKRMVENHFSGNRKDAGICREDRQLYRLTNLAVDNVHGFLGHGKGRIDLCAVYMSGF